MKDKLRRIQAIVTKESFQIIRDPSSILIAFIMPLILLFIYGYGVSLDAEKLRVGVVAEDQSSEVQSFIQSLRDSRYFDIDVAKHRDQLVEGMYSGEYIGFVIIPSYFTEYLKGGVKQAPIQVIADGNQANRAQLLQNYVQGAWMNWLAQRNLTDKATFAPAATIEQRFWYNSELKSRNYLVPGTIALTMTLIGTMLTALVIAREWERGTMEAILATPVTAGELIIGKFIPYFFLGVIAMVICTFLTHFLFQVPFRGSILILFVMTSAFLVAALGIGLLISTVAKNQFLAYQMALTAGFLPAFILSGFIFEISNMPVPIQLITYFIPARYFVSSMQTLFLVGNVGGLLLYNFLSLIVFGAIMILLLIKKTKKQLE